MHEFSYKNQPHPKPCAVLRYGGLGDSIQVSSILPYLKERGYRITVYTTTPGFEILKHDPHIDEFVIQDVDAIPNQDLGEFWRYTAKKYAKFINLSESIERSFLAMPNNTNHGWPHAMRHKYLNKNYMQVIHDIAEVPMPSRMKFYPTAAETQTALDRYETMRGKVILWILSGSAVHKVWPYLDHALHEILRKNDGTNIVLVGDASCKKLEEGWENTPRVHCRSGEWSVRETMTFAQICDLVISPETGIVNAVAFDAVPKIVTLSHSSVDNLTRGWTNCISLEPEATACYPCHQIHFNFDYCRRNEKTGVAECQSDIPLSAMMESIEEMLSLHNEEPLA